jgi:hypothetical protein
MGWFPTLPQVHAEHVNDTAETKGCKGNGCKDRPERPSLPSRGILVQRGPVFFDPFLFVVAHLVTGDVWSIAFAHSTPEVFCANRVAVV